MKFRPCIDLHCGKVKQIVGGTLADDAAGLVENFVSDRGAAYYAALFRADGLTGGHVIMLGPGNEDEARRALETYPGGLQIGGGITAANARSYLEGGASHVIVTSYVFQDGDIRFDKLRELVAAVGKERLVLDLSCRAKDGTYYVVTNRWQQFTGCEVNRANLAELSRYCAEFLIHGVDVEGQCRGVAADLVTKLGQWVEIPTTYAGGARSLADLELVNRLGNGRLDLTIGSSLDIFGGPLSYRAVADWRPPAGAR
ncbi:1-(5-phosphoribosyl)-5-[(5-phosphoribosylamino)methylideneamino] imidazole-4-carboxamide isomerase [Hydrogenispora ethanolica]|jgi:phosphoribosylformimino-5-aminoimidazole carboxamide ribotide isomerase|uniref:1-(5-phosphoribosyl)-5-[(5-phosphoribosylamino)methylideneamino] imidazole-4-carboxamide isomerase n=1 Tax=Hydrogenispora ethanolica TaxID=1082276 RepID=A0A4R1S7X9_HYDET|nr:phosphoribosylformimino-5-aminoimidazole carboxamide ribotide isomerase [Hydrogenispora ethanolica]TCL75204.1 1-(5-phosphoribosyl)-5-[(5-phosphoribosylamino)methylideneamino] imidazole-4-carboxamide isomerase [Hydrogenispora ethanolica]